MKQEKDILKDTSKTPWFKNKNVWIAVLAVIIFVVAIALVLNMNSNSTGGGGKVDGNQTVANTASDLIKEVEYEGMKFDNISLITEKGYSTFTANVTNITSENINQEQVNIALKDKDGNTVINLVGVIGNELKPNETRTITAQAKIDTKNIVSKEITK